MIAIIKSEFNKEIVDGLLEGCKRALDTKEVKLKFRKSKVFEVITVPGAFELPAAVRSCLNNPDYGSYLSSKYKAIITVILTVSLYIFFLVLGVGGIAKNRKAQGLDQYKTSGK